MQESTIEEWNRIFDSLSEKELEFLATYQEHKDPLVLKFFELDDFVLVNGQTPTEGCVIELKRLVKLLKDRVQQEDGE